MNKVTKAPNARLRGRDDDRESKPTTQKAIQTKNTNKIREIMSTFSASKPTNVDAQRIVCVIDALVEKVQTLQYLDSDLFNSLNDKARTQEKEELLAQLTANTHTFLSRELDLEIKLKPLLTGQESIDKTNDETNQASEFANLLSTTAKNLRNLIREVQNNPRDLDILKRLRKNTPLEDYEDFLTYLRGLRLLMLKRLSTSVEEQASHDKQKEELDRKIQLWERTKNNKELELRNLKKEKEKFISEKDEELNKLKAQIEEIEMNKKRRIEDIQSESSKDHAAMKKSFEEKDAQLKKQLKALEDDLKEVRAKNKAEENTLRANNRRDQGNLEEIINNQYDVMMDKNEQELNELETDLQKIEKEIKDYQENIAILKSEEEKEKQIEKKIAQKRELHATEKDRINNIVAAIQHAWNNYKTKAKPSKKKKKGGKDKGKGKK